MTAFLLMSSATFSGGKDADGYHVVTGSETHNSGFLRWTASFIVGYEWVLGSNPLSDWHDADPAPTSSETTPAVGGVATEEPRITFLSTIADDETDFGRDVSVFPTLDTSMSLALGRRVYIEALAKRLVTPRGGLFFHPDYGVDIRDYLSDNIDEAKLHQIRFDVEYQCNQDERTESVDIDIEYFSATETLVIKVEALTAEGPFRFVLEVSALTVALLNEDRNLEGG